MEEEVETSGRAPEADAEDAEVDVGDIPPLEPMEPIKGDPEIPQDDMMVVDEVPTSDDKDTARSPSPPREVENQSTEPTLEDFLVDDITDIEDSNEAVGADEEMAAPPEFSSAYEPPLDAEILPEPESNAPIEEAIQMAASPSPPSPAAAAAPPPPIALPPSSFILQIVPLKQVPPVVIPIPSSPLHESSAFTFDGINTEPTPPAPPKTHLHEAHTEYKAEYPIPPLRSLPIEFNRKARPSRLLRKKEKEAQKEQRGENDKKVKDKEKDKEKDFVPLGAMRWGFTAKVNPVHKRLPKSMKCLSTRNWAVSISVY